MVVLDGNFVGLERINPKYVYFNIS